MPEETLKWPGKSSFLLISGFGLAVFGSGAKHVCLKWQQDDLFSISLCCVLILKVFSFYLLDELCSAAGSGTVRHRGEL